MKEIFYNNGKFKNATQTQDIVGAKIQFEVPTIWLILTISQKNHAIKNLQYALRIQPSDYLSEAKPAILTTTIYGS